MIPESIYSNVLLKMLSLKRLLIYHFQRGSTSKAMIYIVDLKGKGPVEAKVTSHVQLHSDCTLGESLGNPFITLHFHWSYSQ